MSNSRPFDPKLETVSTTPRPLFALPKKFFQTTPSHVLRMKEPRVAGLCAKSCHQTPYFQLASALNHAIKTPYFQLASALNHAIKTPYFQLASALNHAIRHHTFSWPLLNHAIRHHTFSWPLPLRHHISWPLR